MSQTPPPPPPGSDQPPNEPPPSGSDPSFESYSSSPPPPPMDAAPPPPPPPPAGPIPTPYPTGSAYPPPAAPYPPGAGYPVPQRQPYSGAGQPADLMPRFLAKLIDAVVMFGINLVVGLFLAFGLSTGFVTSAVGTLVSTALTLGYYTFLESSRGQTIGKMALGLRVQNLTGQNPTTEQALKRNAYLALSVISVLPFFGSFIAGAASIAAAISIAVTINSDVPLHRGWHDKFGDTQVIKTR